MNFWDERYNRKDYVYGKTPNTFLVEQANLLKPHSRVLCLAEGEGRNAVYLASLGHKVLAVDQSQVGLDKLKDLAQKHGVDVETQCVDLANYQFPVNEFDAIISIWCHLPKQLRKDVHSKVLTSLKKNGLYILEAYTPKQLDFKTGGPSEIGLLMSLEEVKEETSTLTFIVARECERLIEEGIGHNGESAVLQIVGRKDFI